MRIRLLPGNVVMAATDMDRKSPYGSGDAELRKSMTFYHFNLDF